MGLNITGYHIIPLAPNSGLIEWIPNCDTVHALVKVNLDLLTSNMKQTNMFQLSITPFGAGRT